MENEQKSKPRNKFPDRVSLSPEALTRLSEWLVEVEGHLKGNRINRNDLVNFLILFHPAHLSENEKEGLAEKHFDEVAFAEWALRRLKEARAQGQTLSFSELVRNEEPTKQKGGANASSIPKSSK